MHFKYFILGTNVHSQRINKNVHKNNLKKNLVSQINFIKPDKWQLFPPQEPGG